jgi:DNA primase
MTKEWIDFRHVKANAAFEPVLEHYGLETVGRGEQRAILCPFHNETKPSCKINLDKKAFNCFGCGAHGNVLDFVLRMEDCALREAATLVAEWCGIDLAAPTKAAARRKERDKKPAATPRAKSRQGAKPPLDRKESEPEAINPPLTFELKLDYDHPFLAERGVCPEIADVFGLGYCSRGLMKGRICIPIHDETGELVAYAGRWAEAEVPKGVEKYLLPPKFQKSRVLYNLQRLGKSEHLVIVESYWSVFRLHAMGVPAVSPMGRSISAEQVRLIAKTGTPFVTIMFDGDEAGRTAVEAALPLLTPRFFVHVAELPDGEKPHTVEQATLEALVWRP